MTREGLGVLLVDAVREAERDAPQVDPIAALAGARQRRRDRRGYVAMLAFVVFALLVQADAPDAHGEMQPSSLATSATAATPSDGHG